MAEEQFSLCWDHFHKNMSSGMHALLESEELVDVTLAIEGKYLKAHKMVLSVCSPYFRELFQTNPCKHPIVFMKDVNYVVMSALLTFMYKGEVQINQENFANFIKTADALQIKGLTADSNSSEDEFIDVIDADINSIENISVNNAPVSKRPRLATEHEKQSESVLDFKLEPFEVLDQSDSENLDDNLEIALKHKVQPRKDDSEECALLESEEEPQAGTSTSFGNDSQGMIEISKTADVDKLRKKKTVKRTKYIFNGFAYHNKVTAGTPPIRYLACAEMKKNGCRARAIIPVNGNPAQLRVTMAHNHPPNENIEEKEEFFKKLKEAAKIMPGSLRKIYENISFLYPKGAKEIPYDAICSSLHRWRKSPEDDQAP